MTVQSAGTLPRKWPKSASQCGRQAPGRVASTMRQATGMAHPRTTTLMRSTVKRCPKVEASIANARWRHVGSDHATTQRSKGVKQVETSRLRRLSPRLAPLLCTPSRYQSRSCSRTVASPRPSRYAKKVATVVSPQLWATTIPQLHSTNPVLWGWLKCGRQVDTVCDHCNNPMGRVIATSWSDDWLGNHHPTRKMARSSKPYTCKGRGDPFCSRFFE